MIVEDRAAESADRKSRWLFNGLLAILVWAPIPYGSNRPWAVSILLIGTFVLSASWLRGYSKGQYRLTSSLVRAKPVLYVMLAWLMFGLFQILPFPGFLVATLSPESWRVHELAGTNGCSSVSVDTYASLLSFMKSLAYILVFCLCLLLVDTGKRIQKLAQVLVLSGLFQAFYGSLMTLSGLEYGFLIHKYSYIGNATGTFINRNHLAGYLEMCIAVGIGLMISKLGGNSSHTGRQKLRNLIRTMLGEKLRLRLYLAVMVIALVLTHSRMGNTAFFSSMLAAGIIALLLARNASRSMVILLASLILIDIFIVGTWFGMEKVVNRLEHTSMVHDAGRANVDKTSFRIFKDYFFTGSGGGSFYAVFPEYRTADIDAYYDHAHDDYMEFAVEYGIAAILPAIMVLFSVAAAILALHRRKNLLMKGMAFSSLMGILSLMIHSFVDFNLQIPANAMTFMVILSLGWISLFAGGESGIASG